MVNHKPMGLLMKIKEEVLFEDSEIFVKERPSKLSETQETGIYTKLAKEVVKNGWSKNKIDYIVSDLQTLYLSDSGYEKAKDLEYRCGSNYDIDTDFIEWLDDLDIAFHQAITNNVKRWVKAHDIKPKYEVGTKLTINEKLFKIAIERGCKVGENIYINGYVTDEAKYLVSTELNAKKNTLVEYEKIELCCTKTG